MSIVCIPCEIQARELDAKLLLATRLSSQYGHHCLIGFDKYFNYALPSLGPVCLLEKSLSNIMLNGRIKPVKSNNGFVVVSDEEGLNDLNETPISYITRLDPEGWKYIDYYASWGEFDRSFYRKNSNGPDSKLIVLGNCRSDLMGELGKKFYSEDIAAIKQLFGEFILVSDNFSLDHAETGYAPPRFGNLSEQSWQERTKECDWKTETHKARREDLCKLIINYTKYYDSANIVIRPHPNNNPLYWHTNFGKNKKVTTISKLNADPWIHACEAVVSSGCTLGLQAMIAGKKSIHIELNPQDISNSITAKLSHKATSLQELMQVIQKDNTTPQNLTKYWKSEINCSSTELFANLLDEGCKSIKNQPGKIRLPSFPNLKPSPPKWSYENNMDFTSKIRKWAQVINTIEPVVKMISPGVALVSPQQRQ